MRPLEMPRSHGCGIASARSGLAPASQPGHVGQPFVEPLRRKLSVFARAPEPAIAALLVASQALVIALQFGVIPQLRHFWGFNLWQYLPVAAQWALAFAVVLLFWRLPRRVLLRPFDAVRDRILEAPRPAVAVSLAVVVPLMLWQLRERHAFGDSGIIIYATVTQFEFLVPDMGATYLGFRAATRAGSVLGLPPDQSVQLAICLFGSLAVFSIVRVTGLLTADRSMRAWVAAYILSAGMVRILAGHIEVYALVLLGGTLYLWAAFSFLNGKCGFALPCLALGVGAWLHFSFLCLVPSLLLLPWLMPKTTRPRPLAMATHLLLVAVPAVLFLAAMYAAGHHESLKTAWITCERILGLRPEANIPNRWVSLSRDSGQIGTAYALLSSAQLKYLANAFFVLAPSALPALGLFAVLSPRRFAATPETRFLCAACLPLLLYAFALRPLWGPHDWDLFSLTALYLAFLASRLLSGWMAERAAGDLGIWLVAAAHLFVTVPFLWIGISISHPAGPFVHAPSDSSFFQPGTEAYRDFSR